MKKMPCVFQREFPVDRSQRECHDAVKRFAQELLMRGICSTPVVAIATARQFESAWERDETPRAARRDAINQTWTEHCEAMPKAIVGDEARRAWVESGRADAYAAGDKAEAEALKQLDAERAASCWSR